MFDEKLEWTNNSELLQKKINQRLFFMKRLASFNIDLTLLNLFYESCVLSLLTFCVTAWGGNVKAKDKRKMNRCIKHANKLLKNTQYKTLNDLLQESSTRKLTKIIEDCSHPLNSFIKISVRSGRLIHVITKTNRHLNSFLPYAIRNYNT